MPLLNENPDDRVMVFIDLRNVKESVKNLDEFPIDYYRLTLDLVGRRKLIAAYIFDAIPHYGDDETIKLHDNLRFQGFRVVTKRIQKETENINGQEITKIVQKEVDVALACEMVVHALMDHYDIAIVVSGDRDFVPAIEHIHQAGKRVIVASFTDCFAKDMLKVCDRYIKLDDKPILQFETILKKPETAKIDSSDVQKTEADV